MKPYSPEKRMQVNPVTYADGYCIMTITKRNGQKFEVLFDPSFLEKLSQHTWLIDGRGYAIARQKNPNSADEQYRQNTIFMHRLIFGPIGEGSQVDHRNHIRTDNRLSNLRECTCAENQQNRLPQGKTSQYKGVAWKTRENRWRVCIRVGGRLISLGRFKDEQKAALAYDKAAKKHFGDFAYLNFQNESHVE